MVAEGDEGCKGRWGAAGALGLDAGVEDVGEEGEGEEDQKEEEEVAEAGHGWGEF